MCGNGYCSEAGDGFKSLTCGLFFFQWPLWNCSRWKWGQSTDIWMTVCLLVRYNHQLSDPVNALVKAVHWFLAFLHIFETMNIICRPFFMLFNKKTKCKVRYICLTRAHLFWCLNNCRSTYYLSIHVCYSSFPCLPFSQLRASWLRAEGNSVFEGIEGFSQHSPMAVVRKASAVGAERTEGCAGAWHL